MNDVLKSSHPETFQIKVSLYECRQLTLETDDVPNPYIVVKIGDETKTTNTLRENPDPIYNSIYDFQIIATENELKTQNFNHCNERHKLVST